MSRIKTKNSTTAASVPASGSLLQGEVAINIADKKLYVGNASGNPIEITSQGVTTVTGTPSGVYVTQATGSTTIGLQTNVFVSGSLHVSCVLTESPAALNIFASEDPATSESRMINMKSYSNNYAEINVADDGSLILKSQTNVVNINPTGTSAVYLDTASSTGYLYTTPTDIRIGGSSAVTTFPGDVTITKTLTVDHINGELDGAVLKACKNTDSIALRKGDPVFIAGTVGATEVLRVELARSDTEAKMPAVGLLTQDLAVNATGHLTVLGTLPNVDTSAFTVGNSVFVASTGWITNIRPTGASVLVQNIGRIGRVNSNNGQIIVLGPGRTNDVPNNILASGTLTLGTPDIITPLAGTASVFNTNVSRVNIGNSASGVQIGNATGVVIVGDVAVNNGAITTTAATATLFNASATTVNIGGAAATMNVGATGCTLVLRGSINATGSIFNNGTISTTGHITAASGYRITSAAINAQTATGYTLVATDNGRIITFDSAATHTLRIPTGLDIGFNATVIQLGTGQVTCTGLSGATVNCYASGNKILGQHGSASVICYASNVYNLAGTLGI